MAKYPNFKRGDIAWINFSPSKGSEQRGLRPAVVLTPSKYHLRSGMVVVCPITSKSKGYPFEASLPLTSKVQGVVLCDQIKSFHITSRVKGFAGQVPKRTLGEIEDNLKILLQFS